MFYIQVNYFVDDRMTDGIAMKFTSLTQEVLIKLFKFFKH